MTEIAEKCTETFGDIMDTLDYDIFLKQLKLGDHIDETCFYFVDDEIKMERYLGYLPQYDKPYWVGYCDAPDGKEFETAEELIKAPIFNGKSLKERWNEVRILSIEGCGLKYWIDHVL